eukprot:g457.t1
MQLQHPRSVKSVTVHERAPSRLYFGYAILAVLYSVTLYQCYITSGLPYQQALAEGTDLAVEKGVAPPSVDFHSRAVDDLTKRLGGIQARGPKFEFDEGLNDWGEDDEDENEDEDAWGEEKEEEKDETMKAEEDEDFDVDDDDDDEVRPLPSKWLPSIIPSVSLFLLLNLTALFPLLCHWSVDFKAYTLFTKAKKVRAGCYMLVRPHEHRGKPALCLVKQAKHLDRLVFEFQRQKYEFFDADETKRLGIVSPTETKESKANSDTHNAEEDPNEIVGECTEHGCVRIIQCICDAPLSFYVNSRGIQGKQQVDKAEESFGLNRLSIAMPSFLELYRDQLLAPLCIFQVFVAFLWLLDEYWQYTLFNLFSILMLESTTTFQRRRTLQTLAKMAQKPYPLQVYRHGCWRELTTAELLPGDLISVKPKAKPTTKEKFEKMTKEEQKKHVESVKARQARAAKAGAAGIGVHSDVVPCDCVMLDGSAVVNESSLTGESVPQMKDALRCRSTADEKRSLDPDGRDRVHVLFSGTSVITAAASKSGNTSEKKSQDISKALPVTPDGGCLCYVMRTGFSSSQGGLMQMIEFASTQKVSGDSKEIGLALLLLLCFALVASGYVLKKGLEKGDRTTHELLLKCVIIITSVVPRGLPLQMAMAVNTALLNLTKAGLFCTEPYRVPYAGKISHCLFDKTGTITTDTLSPVGVVGVDAEPDTELQNGVRKTSAVHDASGEAALVLSSCHSLVHVKDVGMVGDPIELAALAGVRWQFDAATATATPGTGKALKAKEKMICDGLEKLLTEEKKARKEKSLNQAKIEMFSKNKKKIEEQLSLLRGKMEEVKKKAKEAAAVSSKILHRYHFSSKLQRMSVVCKVEGKTNGLPSGSYCLAKGSPEAIKPLLVADSAPSWFDSTYRHLAEHGMRVLALAYKRCSTKDMSSHGNPGEGPSRSWVESELHFAGFIAFACKIRKDSKTVIGALRESGHRVAMITGDAPLTALHVAKEVGIAANNNEKSSLLLSIENDKIVWSTAVGPISERKQIQFDPSELPSLSKKYDLVVTEKVLRLAAEDSDGDLWTYVDEINVFARMSPHGKAKIIREMQRRKGYAVLMCGDGGNDVGALKQADVGLALLSGYGNSNTGGGKSGKDSTNSDSNSSEDKENVNDSNSLSEVRLNQEAKEMAKEQARLTAHKKAILAAKQKELTAKQQEWLKEEMEKLKAQGQTGFMANITALKNVTFRIRDEMAKESRKLGVSHNVYTKDAGGLAGLDLDSEEAMQGMGVPMVRPGDASVAAPFTSRTPTIRTVVDIIRQGRCTLLSALQQQQIMMLECIISAYTLSALSLEGARSSERQLMASSWLIMIASVAFSYATPVDRMHKQRPLKSLFHPTIFVSMLGQACIHLYCMVTAVGMATAEMGPKALKAVVAFNRKAAKSYDEDYEALQSTIAPVLDCTPGDEGCDIDSSNDEAGSDLDPFADIMFMWSRPFMPNLMNTVVFLVETSSIVAVLFVNYKGRPWMKGTIENHALFLSIFVCIAGVGACAWAISPTLNAMIHLEAFPNDEFRYKTMGLVFLALFGTFIWDRICTAIFSPKIFTAMMESARKTSLKDLKPIFMTLGKVILGLVVLGTGNIFIWGGLAYWWYRRKKAASAELLKET